LSLRVYTTPAVVLHRINLGENDKILTLFTRERGKLSAVAKGSRKPISKLAGATELFTHSRMQLAVGRSLDVITQAEIAHPFQRIRGDLTRIAYASFLTELVERFTAERDPHAAVFDLLVETLSVLERTPSPGLVAQLFALRLLANLGYRPHLEDCVTCHQAVDAEPAAFSPSLGGVLCAAHRRRHADVIPVRLDTLALARMLLRIPPTDAAALQTLAEHALPTVCRELDKVLRAHLQYRLERPLRSLDFIQEIQAMDATAST
jgi:DNA repair protein RecO (recombination protein O)